MRLLSLHVLMCLTVAVVGQGAQVGSSSNHCFGFVGDGSMSYVALMTKLMLFALPPPPIHCSHLAREPGFALLAVSSCWCTSSATNILHSDVVTVCQVGCLPPGQSLFVPAGHAPPCLRDSVDVAFCSVLVGVHFWPADCGGAALLMVWSLESFNVNWSLTFEHLYFSVRLMKGIPRTGLRY